MKDNKEKKILRKLKGVVVSDKPDKTIIVKVETKKAHPKYGKIVKSHKKYHAHDEKNEFKTGDVVTIVECPPHSRTKRWEVVNTKES